MPRGSTFGGGFEYRLRYFRVFGHIPVSQFRRPLPRSVENTQHLDSVGAHPVWNDIRRSSNHEFPCALHATGPAQSWIPGEQGHGVLNRRHYARRSGRIVAGDVLSFSFEVR
jgi:hypothetical protein